MTLTSGTHLGPYEIVGALGAGGMGEVYRARDPRLGRDVAIKVLPAGASHDVDRLRRFEHEARAVATINHPNVLAVHDVGSHDGTPYLVLELLEGETLRERLESGAIGVRKAVDYALQIARGLAAAHDRGIAHRDLKPENVFLVDGDRVKILDFGLAKALADAAPPDAATAAASPATEAGVVLGTVGYMAPEQVRGQGVDHTADIFSFGCVFHEMLSGQRAFSGATSADTMSAILSKDPPELDVSHDVPPALERIVRRCLEKSPALRFRSAQDLVFAIENVTMASQATTGLLPGPIEPDQPSRGRRPLLGAALALGVAIGAAVMMAIPAMRTREAPAMSLGRTTLITHEDGQELHPSISPDGAFVAYAAGPSDQMHIYVRQVAGGRAIDLTASMPGSFGHPRWSHDGTRILFAGTTGAYVVPALGGAARRVLDRVGMAEWSPDSREIAFTTDMGTGGGPGRVYTRAVDDSTPRTVTEALEPHSLAWSPDGRLIAFVSGNAAFAGPGRLVGNVAPSSIMVVEASGGSAVAVTSGSALNTSPTWTPDSRRLLFVSDVHGTRDVFEVALMADGHPEGEPRRLTAGLNAHTVSLSRNGARLAYATLTLSSNIWSIQVPARPPISVREAIPLTRGLQIVEALAISADGRWLAFDSNLSGNQDVYRMRLPDGEVEQVTTHPADEFAPSWSPDATQIVFHAWPRGNRDLVIVGADGRGRQELTSLPGHEWYPDWSPDGSRIAFIDGNTGGVSVLRREGGGWSAPVPLHTDGLTFPIFAPDGQSLLLAPLRPVEAGAIRVTPADGGPTRTLVRGPLPGTTALPSFAIWSADGSVVYFLGIDELGRSSFWSIPAEGGTPTPIVRFDDPARESNRPEFATDGRRLYFTLAQKEGDVWVMEIPRP